ncbi:MAG TPA: Mur ligase family protein [Gemmatimonadales bacterium]|nr:Mur ligase family protein [Gemmatimonadales bacterium]
MKLLDSRRVTGPGLLLDGPGAVLDVELDPQTRDRAIEAWREAATRMLAAVGLPDAHLRSRCFQGGATLGFTAPPDVLYTATELNEWAWASAEATMAGAGAPATEPDAARLRAALGLERNPALLAIRAAARTHGLNFLAGEEQVSAGSGTGSRVWPERELPDPEQVPWDRLHDIPIALVTGSNGKTTVVRLLAAMAMEAGRVTGTTTTDGVALQGRFLEESDFSGPSGARMLLRRPEVETAILETARGGLLRRGLAVEHALAAVVTNIAADHLGEFGVQTLAELAETKLLVARAVGPGGRVVLNADDPVLAMAGGRISAELAWFSLDPANPLMRAHVESGGTAAVLDGSSLVLIERGRRTILASTEAMPIALGGAARHNVANALAAVAAAGALGIDHDAVRRALERFGRNPTDNPGRANVIELGGAHIYVDYVHNPHGMAALATALERFPGRRRLVLLGQAGDRDDAAIRELARSALGLRPDRVVLKEMEAYLRGRATGEVSRLMTSALTEAGYPREKITSTPSELDAVRAALTWAEPGDLLVFGIHQDRRAVMTYLDSLRGAGWTAGRPLPAHASAMQ